MKVWIAVVALLLLLALAFREGFNNYEEALKDVGQKAGYITPKCDSGFTLNSDESSCEKPKSDGTKETKTPTCPTGSSFVNRGVRGVCEPSDAPSTPSPSTTTRTSSSATVAGGSSGNLIGPTSGGVGKKGKTVWGPLFTGVGTSAAQGGDSTKSNTYPNLLGGTMGKQNSRIDGVAITSPSQPGFDLGALPSSSSLGTDANARFLPFSRAEAEGDPYRLAKGYSVKNYSPENEPVPFLTDFSAFFK